MNDPEVPPVPTLETGPRMSLPARLMSIFTGPGEAFDEIKRGPPSTANWLVPTLLLCLVGVISAFVIFSQDSIMQQIREQQEHAMEKKLQKVPKEQREQIMATVEKWSGPSLMKIFGSAGAIARSFGWLFLAAVVLWLLGTRVFKGDFTYMQAVEVCGLAAMITVLGGIISTLLIVVMGSTLATPGPALLIHELNPANPVHLLLAALNVMTLWYLGVLSLGMSKLSGASLAKPAVWLFSLWAVFTSGLILLGWAAQKVAAVASNS